jgi:hypothetical protein
VTNKFGRRLIRCSVCYKNPHAAAIGKSTRPPAIATATGTTLYADVVENHLVSPMHAAAVIADRLNKLSEFERQQETPIRKLFAHSDEKLAQKIGQSMIEVYADAKKGISAWSWPARHVAHHIADNFKPNEPFTHFVPATGSLTYVNPVMQQELLRNIVKPELTTLRQRIVQSLAVSLRVDGSVDRRQVDNKHCMLKIVDKSGEEETVFLGFAEPEKRGTDGYVDAIKQACGNVIDWCDLLPKLSSIVTDGESLNTGRKQSLWASLDRMRSETGQHNLMKIWCAVHRSNLVWNSVTTSVTEIKHLIIDARALASYYRCSGLRTKELHSVQLPLGRHIVAFPAYFEVRWMEYVHQVLTSVWCNLIAVFSHLSSNDSDPEARAYLRKWTEVGRLQLLVVTIDVLYLFSRMQITLQTDSCLIFDIRRETTAVIMQLNAMKSGPLLGGEEEKFQKSLSGQNQQDGQSYTFENQQLWQKCRRNQGHNAYVSETREHVAVRLELIESVINFLTARLPDAEFSSLEPLRKLNPLIADSALRDCHGAVAPDLALKDFACAYKEAAQSTNLQALNARQLLHETLKNEQWRPLSVALARIVASKPHSADVERLISSYSGLKTNIRSSLSSSTLHAYLFIRQNMPTLSTWDPRPAVQAWINEKSRRPNQTHTAAACQEYFKGIFH